VIIVLAVIAALQNPQVWRRDWQTTQQFVTQKWQTLHHGWEHQEPTTKAPSVPKKSPAPVVVAKPIPGPSPAIVRAAAPKTFPQNLNASQYALLMAAREAFWQHDAAVALADYHALIRQLPHIPQLYGEVGNIYYQTGHPLSAGEAYAEAAKTLIAERQYSSAAALLPLISTLNPNQAPLIRQALAR